MKRLILIGLLLLASNAWSASYTIEWGFTPPSSPAVTGFKVYKNNTALTTFTGSSITSGTFTDTLVVGDIFELTALFDDATESAKSAQYVWGGKKWVHVGTGSGMKIIKLSTGKTLRLQ